MGDPASDHLFDQYLVAREVELDARLTRCSARPAVVQTPFR
jgi:hypothetical protein